MAIILLRIFVSMCQCISLPELPCIMFLFLISLLRLPTPFPQSKMRPKSVLSDRILSGTQTLKLKASFDKPW